MSIRGRRCWSEVLQTMSEYDCRKHPWRRQWCPVLWSRRRRSRQPTYPICVVVSRTSRTAHVVTFETDFLRVLPLPHRAARVVSSSSTRPRQKHQEPRGRHGTSLFCFFFRLELLSERV